MLYTLSMHWAESVYLWMIVAGTLVFVLGTWWVLGTNHMAESNGEDVELGLGAHAPRLPARRPIELGPDQRCPYCHDVLELTQGLHECPECGTVAHWECNREMGCPTLGCSAKFETRPPAARVREGGDPEGGK